MSDYTWSPRAGRYRDASGRFVAEAAVRAAVDAVVDGGTERIVALTRQLQQLQGQPVRSVQQLQSSLARWQQQMAAELKAMYVATAMVANGGRQQMAPSDYGRVGARLREQYQFLGQFAADVASGQQPLDGRLLTRAELYGQAARAGFEAERRRLAGIRGDREERNELRPADHCSECVAQTGRGWVPLGTLVPVGQRICRSRCRCAIRTRKGAA